MDIEVFRQAVNCNKHYLVKMKMKYGNKEIPKKKKENRAATN